MTSSYDSVFTNRMFFGDKGLNMNNPLTKNLWKKLPLNLQNLANPVSPSNGYFFIVKKFNANDSQTIIKAIQENGIVYFDNNGNLEIGDKTTKAVKLNYKNVLNNKKFDDLNKGNIFTDLTGKSVKLVRNDLVLSNNKYWILYTENSICYILYNPIHRQSFKDFYNNQQFDSSGGSNNILNNIFTQYCEITSLQADGNKLRSYADGTCNCFRKEDCIDNATGIHIDSQKYRNSVGNKCVCAAPNCDDDNVTSTSFMYKDGKSYKERVSKIEPCPSSITSVICTTEISAAGNVNMTGSKISQQCGLDSTTAPPQSQGQSPADTVPVTTKRPVAVTTLAPAPINKSWCIFL
jgi:hypothetical protein